VVDGFTFSLDSVAPVRREVGVGEVGDHSLGVVQQGVAGDERQPGVPADVVEGRAGVATDEEVRGDDGD